MAFPFDGTQWTPLRNDLSGDDAINVDADWFYSYTLYTDATTLYDWSAASDHRLVLKEKPTDADADYKAVGTVTSEDATGEGYFHLPDEQTAKLTPGKRYWYSWDALFSGYWMPMMHGVVSTANRASYEGDPPSV